MSDVIVELKWYIWVSGSVSASLIAPMGDRVVILRLLAVHKDLMILQEAWRRTGVEKTTNM